MGSAGCLSVEYARARTAVQEAAQPVIAHLSRQPLRTNCGRLAAVCHDHPLGVIFVDRVHQNQKV